MYLREIHPKLDVTHKFSIAIAGWIAQHMDCNAWIALQSVSLVSVMHDVLVRLLSLEGRNLQWFDRWISIESDPNHWSLEQQQMCLRSSIFIDLVCPTSWSKRFSIVWFAIQLLELQSYEYNGVQNK